jgi:hypothetical protein
MICTKSGKNWSSGSGEEVENVKVYRQTDGGQGAIRKAHLSFQIIKPFNHWHNKSNSLFTHTGS